MNKAVFCLRNQFEFIDQLNVSQTKGTQLRTLHMEVDVQEKY